MQGETLYFKYQLPDYLFQNPKIIYKNGDCEKKSREIAVEKELNSLKKSDENEIWMTSKTELEFPSCDNKLHNYFFISKKRKMNNGMYMLQVALRSCESDGGSGKWRRS